MKSQNSEMWNINKQISYLKTCLVRVEFWYEFDVMIDLIQLQSTEMECEKSFNLRHHVNMIRPSRDSQLWVWRQHLVLHGNKNMSLVESVFCCCSKDYSFLTSYNYIYWMLVRQDLMNVDIIIFWEMRHCKSVSHSEFAAIIQQKRLIFLFNSSFAWAGRVSGPGRVNCNCCYIFTTLSLLPPHPGLTAAVCLLPCSVCIKSSRNWSQCRVMKLCSDPTQDYVWCLGQPL